MAGWPVQWPHYLHQCVKTLARARRQGYISDWRHGSPHVRWISVTVTFQWRNGSIAHLFYYHYREPEESEKQKEGAQI